MMKPTNLAVSDVGGTLIQSADVDQRCYLEVIELA